MKDFCTPRGPNWVGCRQKWLSLIKKSKETSVMSKP